MERERTQQANEGLGTMRMERSVLLALGAGQGRAVVAVFFLGWQTWGETSGFPVEVACFPWESQVFMLKTGGNSKLSPQVCRRSFF